MGEAGESVRSAGGGIAPFRPCRAQPRTLHPHLAARGQAWAQTRLGDLAGARTALEEAIRLVEAERVSVADDKTRANIAETHAAIYRDLVAILWDTVGADAAAQALEVAEAGRARALSDALSWSKVVGVAAPTLSAGAVQGTLASDEALIEYVSSEDRLFAITVTREQIAFTALPLAGTAAGLDRRVDFFSALVQEKDEPATAPAARRLYADMLAPAIVALNPKIRTLIIAADGPLHRMPFDALGEASRVIERFDVVMIPSASALASRVRATPPSAAALIVAGPMTPIGPALPASAAEAAVIQGRLAGEVLVLSGSEATQKRVQDAHPGRFAVLHFASHAQVDGVSPLRSALLLTPDAVLRDGRWTAQHIYGSELNADLVVLSACGTGAGLQTRGEGVMSLSRAFLYAGAGATIATLWDVPDAPGPLFADILYRELSAGRPLGAAAADARRELRRQGAPPRAWAAYALTGHPTARVNVTARTDFGVWTARFASAFAILFLAAALPTRFALSRSRRQLSLGLAGVCLVVVAFAPRPMSDVRPVSESGSNVGRGVVDSLISVDVANGAVTWHPADGVTDYFVESYDAEGRPIGVPEPGVSPFRWTASASHGWIRVEGRRHGVFVKRSALTPLP